MDLSRVTQTSTNTSEFDLTPVEVRNDTESARITVEGLRSELDFPNICKLFHRFSNVYNDYLVANVTD